ncbi:RsfA family transcriptional regulator [Jeotgalibacillus soli]|uniref:Myb-like domain-containing protein n=1 Tax=Jeotgalibacillus soli TaxID=889306 RepID=A0A0C2RSN9_9BACL|nr:RsfA family transcriptional regulator [Jeotgalibacillus soli]KIL44779.1 hypothetical protein KP78_23230 [Jeotgalibacillus soli]
MTKHRQDGWTAQEDRWLADAVLAHIKSGSTQLKAFEEIGEKVNRTAAACGFRWNSCLRKECQQLIDEAKKERYASRKTMTPNKRPMANSPMEWSANELSAQLENWIEKITRYEKSEDWERKCKTLEFSLDKITKEKEKLEKKVQGLEEDYRALLFLIEKARKLGVAEESMESASEAPIFQMEANGNLFRLNRKNGSATSDRREAMDV